VSLAVKMSSLSFLLVLIFVINYLPSVQAVTECSSSRKRVTHYLSGHNDVMLVAENLIKLFRDPCIEELTLEADNSSLPEQVCCIIESLETVSRKSIILDGGVCTGPFFQSTWKAKKALSLLLYIQDQLSQDNCVTTAIVSDDVSQNKTRNTWVSLLTPFQFESRLLFFVSPSGAHNESDQLLGFMSSLPCKLFQMSINPTETGLNGLQ